MKIPIWKCTHCGNQNCIQIRVDDPQDAPLYCNHTCVRCTWEASEIEINELLEFLREYSENEIGEHFHLIDGCKLQRGICPKTSDGQCSNTCEVIKRVNRSS